MLAKARANRVANQSFDSSAWSPQARRLTRAEILDFVAALFETPLFLPPDESFVHRVVQEFVPILGQKANQKTNHEQ